MRKFRIQNRFCAILGSRDIWKTKCGSEVVKFELILVARSTFLLRVISEHLKRSQTGHWLTLIPLNEPLEAPSYWNWSTRLLDYFQIGFLSKYAIIQNKKIWVFHINLFHKPHFVLKISREYQFSGRKNTAKRNMSSAVWASSMCKMF